MRASNVLWAHPRQHMAIGSSVPVERHVVGSASILDDKLLLVDGWAMGIPIEMTTSHVIFALRWRQLVWLFFASRIRQQKFS